MIRVATVALFLLAASTANATLSNPVRPAPSARTAPPRAVRVAVASKEFVAKGKAAMDRVRTQIPDLAALTRLINDASGGKHPAVTSCNFTAEVVGNAVSHGALQVPARWHEKNVAQRAAAIAELLNSPKMVYVNIVPDHHFIVFPIDSDKVALLQGFQGVYSYIDWMEHRGQGVMRKDEFNAAMADLVGANEARKRAAAVKLFSYSLAHEGKQVAAHDPAHDVEREIHAYYDDKAITIPTVGFKDL